MTDTEIKLLLKTIAENQKLMIKITLDMWNAEKPHFGGVSPHRYEGRAKRCWYCNRPLKWVKVNAVKQTFKILEILGVKK